MGLKLAGRTQGSEKAQCLNPQLVCQRQRSIYQGLVYYFLLGVWLYRTRAVSIAMTSYNVPLNASSNAGRQNLHSIRRVMKSLQKRRRGAPPPPPRSVSGWACWLETGHRSRPADPVDEGWSGKGAAGRRPNAGPPSVGRSRERRHLWRPAPQANRPALPEDGHRGLDCDTRPSPSNCHKNLLLAVSLSNSPCTLS